MSATRDDLKPCPFCGGTFVAQGASNGYISVWCGCGARGPETAFPEICVDPASAVDQCRVAWNRRASKPPRTRYTTVDPSEGEQAKPCYPDPVMDAVRRCAEIADADRAMSRKARDRYADTDLFGKAICSGSEGAGQRIGDEIRREFGLLPTSET